MTKSRLGILMMALAAARLAAACVDAPGIDALPDDVRAKAPASLWDDLPRRPIILALRPGLLTAVFADRRFRRLLIVLAVGGIASAIPATLVLFFIADVLRLAEWQGLFLVIYFVCGGIAPCGRRAPL